MKILLITPSIPNHLNRIRALQILRALAREHEVHLVSLKHESEPDVSGLSQYCKSITLVRQPHIKSLLQCARAIFSSTPLEVAYCRSRRMERIVRGLIVKKCIDLVYVKRLRAAQFIGALETLDLSVVLDSTDAMSLFYERMYRAAPWYQKPLSLSEGIRYRRYEKKLFRKFPHWVLCSPEDIAYLEMQASADTAERNVRNMPVFHLVPNTVPEDFFNIPDAHVQKGTLLFSGLMDKFVNIEGAQYFVRDIFPTIARIVPDAQLRIVGPRPSRTIRRLATKNIIIVGMVPDIRQEIAASEVVVCPIKIGTGTRNKIIQAWAVGRPVVSTSLGIAGLTAENGTHALIADTPEEFASSVVQLLQDQQLQHHLIQNARRLAEREYSASALENSLSGLIRNVTGKP